MQTPLSPLGRLRWGFWPAYVVCAIVGLVAIWGHHFPPGIDLPQHANLFRIWARLGEKGSGYSFYYEVLPFTPYLLTYLVALPLTKLGGAMFATKTLLSVALLATPWQMARWLKSVGGEVWWALGGFVVAMGFGFYWGFLSWMLSFPVAFAYFAALEKQRATPTPRVLAETATLAVVLFFCHAMTFGIALIVAGLYALMARRPKAIFLQGIHALPVVLVVAWWTQVPKRPPIAHPPGWPPEIGRLASLFGGTFSAHADYWWAIVGLAIVVVTFAVAKPTLASEPRRWLPAALALIGFATLPDTINNVWLIGTRAVGFVHAFAPVALDPGSDEATRRRTRWLSFVLVLAALVALNVRLTSFNRELDGLEDIIAAVEPNSDVHGLVPETGGDSEVLGPWALGQVMAWIPAYRGGILENDSGQYNTIPVQRRIDVARPNHFRYYLTHGSPGMGEGLASARAGIPVRVVKRAGRWNLFEARRPPVRLGPFEVVRWGQEWGELQVDAAVSSKPLTIAGRRFDHGFGTHTRSSIELRLEPRPAGAGALRFSGKVGLDEGADCQGRATFAIFGLGHRRLWQSGLLRTGDAVQEFSVELPAGARDLLLVATPDGSNGCGHVDWVDLSAS